MIFATSTEEEVVSVSETKDSCFYSFHQFFPFLLARFLLKFWKINVLLKLLIIHIIIDAINFPYRAVNGPTASINYITWQGKREANEVARERETNEKTHCLMAFPWNPLKILFFVTCTEIIKRNFWRGSELFYTPGKWNRLSPYRVLFKGVYRISIWGILFLVVFRDNSFFLSEKKSPFNC